MDYLATYVEKFDPSHKTLAYLNLKALNEFKHIIKKSAPSQIGEARDMLDFSDIHSPLFSYYGVGYCMSLALVDWLLSGGADFKKISLRGNSIDDSMIDSLAPSLAHHSSITHLDLSSNLITDKGVETLTKLAENSSWEQLNLRRNGLISKTEALLNLTNKNGKKIDVILSNPLEWDLPPLSPKEKRVGTAFIAFFALVGSS